MTAVFFILRNYVKKLDFFYVFEDWRIWNTLKKENFTYFNSAKFEKCQKSEQKSKENWLKHRKQSKIFACGALREQKMNLNINILTYLCNFLSRPKGEKKNWGVLTARRANFFWGVLSRPKGGFFLRIRKTKKKHC